MNLTKSEIQKELDKLGVEYDKKDSKENLAVLLEETEQEKHKEKPKKEKKKKPKKQTAYFNGVKILKIREVKDKEKNRMIKVSLLDGTVKKVPKSEYEYYITYK